MANIESNPVQNLIDTGRNILNSGGEAVSSGSVDLHKLERTLEVAGGVVLFVIVSAILALRYCIDMNRRGRNILD